MASSRVMPPSSSSATAASPDLGRQASIYSPTISELHASGDPTIKALGSMSMDDLFLNIYADTATAAPDPQPLPPQGKTVDEVWKEISVGRTADDGDGPEEVEASVEMTLEDFLARTGAVRAEEVGITSGTGQGGFAVDPAVGVQFEFGKKPEQIAEFPLENPMLGFGNGVEGAGRGRGGRGKKRLVMDPVDREALQRQKRMIKNRESAARSRERKQAYTVELESLVSQLEEENATLERELEKQSQERLKQLMKNIVPVTEKKKPPRELRSSSSMQW